MAGRETRTISFTPQQALFIEQCVSTGRYQSASEVVRAGLRLLHEEEQTHARGIQTLQVLIAQGAADLKKKRLVPAQEVFDSLRAKRSDAAKADRSGKPASIRRRSR